MVIICFAGNTGCTTTPNVAMPMRPPATRRLFIEIKTPNHDALRYRWLSMRDVCEVRGTVHRDVMVTPAGTSKKLTARTPMGTPCRNVSPSAAWEHPYHCPQHYQKRRDPVADVRQLRPRTEGRPCGHCAAWVGSRAGHRSEVQMLRLWQHDGSSTSLVGVSGSGPTETWMRYYRIPVRVGSCHAA